MRVGSVQEIVGYAVDDDAILDVLFKSVPLTPNLKLRLKAAYGEYRRTRGSTGIRALSLKDPWPDTFSGLYSGRARKHGLHWIEDIATTPNYGYCPMCGGETHKTVDHYLPRSPWAEFSFFSANLVPSCGNCNTKRGNRASSPGSKPRIFHPYFDVVHLSRQLHVTSLRKPFELPLFVATPNPRLSRGLKSRVRYHIEHSIDEVVYQQFCINRWIELFPKAQRKTTLQSFRLSIKNLAEDSRMLGGPNSWRSAFYTGLCMNRAAVNWLYANRNAFS